MGQDVSTDLKLDTLKLEKDPVQLIRDMDVSQAETFRQHLRIIRDLFPCFSLISSIEQ